MSSLDPNPLILVHEQWSRTDQLVTRDSKSVTYARCLCSVLMATEGQSGPSACHIFRVVYLQMHRKAVLLNRKGASPSATQGGGVSIQPVVEKNNFYQYDPCEAWVRLDVPMCSKIT